MGTITPLPTVRAISQQSAIDVLETYLERARKGEIIAVGVAAVTPDGVARYGYSEPEDGLRLLGAVKLHETYVALSLDEESE